MYELLIKDTGCLVLLLSERRLTSHCTLRLKQRKYPGAKGHYKRRTKGQSLFASDFKVSLSAS